MAVKCCREWVASMSVTEIERLIRDRHRALDEVRLTPLKAETLLQYRLEPEEREAILAKNYAWLYRHGVHPMAVLFLSQDNREPMAKYLAAIGAAEERVDQLGSLFSRASERGEEAGRRSRPDRNMESETI